MGNGFSDAVERLLGLSQKLNSLAAEYQNQTVIIQNLLANGNEESLFKIGDVLNNRETLIKSYDQAAEELKQEEAVCTKTGVITEEVSRRLDSLGQERRAVFHNIQAVEDRSRKIMSSLYNENRGHIKQIEQGKKLMNAYQSAPQINDGLFIDRRK